jgi:hypothetical protein
MLAAGVLAIVPGQRQHAVCDQPAAPRRVGLLVAAPPAEGPAVEQHLPAGARFFGGQSRRCGGGRRGGRFLRAERGYEQDAGQSAREHRHGVSGHDVAFLLVL